MLCLSLPSIAAVAALLTPVYSAGTKSYNGLALTPAMGWDNWNAFGCKITEDLLLGTAKKIVEFGLRDLGAYNSSYPIQICYD